MPALSDILTQVSDFLYSTFLVWLLIGAGCYFTIRTRGVQLRHSIAIALSMVGSRASGGRSLSSFQAFAVGLACRVGTGNIVGVALALVLGGPGAILWMWVVALLGTATAFTESTLAQVLKVRHRDGGFRGGPPYYIAKGLRLPWLGALFAVFFLAANGLSMPMVQSNAVAGALGAAGAIPAWGSALIVVALTTPVLLGGLKAIGRVAEVLAPLMAAAYLLAVLGIVVTHPAASWQALTSIIEGAFGLRAGLAGLAGGVVQAILNGVRRGLFSNEAGLGGAACASGSAAVRHPVQQGLIQALGVVIDTILVCTATALAILIAGEAVYAPGVTGENAVGSLTQDAIALLVGEWTRWPMAILIVVLAYTTIIGAFSYAQVCLDYLTESRWASKALQCAAVACAALGSFQRLTTVWTLADILLSVGAVINLVALVALIGWVLGALRDWEAQRRQGVEPVFIGHGNPLLPGDTNDGVWEVAPSTRA
ncbi:alanine/glycine:cation symporter family protein [Actinomyces timonensis]|uniref:Alanine/glycine:cation symporter family protein n=1 Tax=Actinomyces timonensis TaxID=1288391 RepID=A0AAU8N207_9ACTO